MKFRKFRPATAACALLVAVGGCTATQIQSGQQTQAQIQTAIADGCTVANEAASAAAPFGAVPQVAGVIVYIQGGCATATAIAALVTKASTDPTTVAWLENLPGEVNSAVAVVKAAIANLSAPAAAVTVQPAAAPAARAAAPASAS